MKSNRNYLVIAMLGFAFLLSCKSKPLTKPSIIVGYIAGWKNTDFQTIDANKFTHINYAFANIVNGKMLTEQSYDTLRIAELQKLKLTNPNLKLLISVGGWGWSTHFSDVALTHESRAVFVKSAVDYIQYFQFDGVDLDWEYPGQAGAGNVFRPEDKENFSLLLRDLRHALDSASQKQGRKEKYLLTIATGADQNYMNHTELGTAHQYLDFINIMSYDFGTGGAYLSGFHSNLRTAEEAPNTHSVVKSVEVHLKAGIPASKLVMGLPFYGRQFYGVQLENNGKYQKSRTSRGALSHKQVVEHLKDPAFEQFWDEYAEAPYLFNRTDSVFIGYDNKRSFTAKYAYLKEMGMAGFMFWEYNSDNGNELLDIVNELIHQ